LTDLYSIEVRQGGRKNYLFYFFAILFVFSFGFSLPSQRKESIDFFFGKWSFTKLPFFLGFAFVPSLCLFYYFDRGIKVRIDSEGIWSRKNGNIGWDEIWNFSSTFSKGPRYGDIYQLLIRLKDTETRLDEEVILKFQGMDKSFDEIRPVVEYYARKHKIEDSGHVNLL
jgi:hypothetical protein